MTNKDSNNNLIIAILLSVAILVGFHYLYEKPRMEAYRQQQLLQQKATAEPAKPVPATVELRDRDGIIREGKRIKIETAELHGSLNLKGARLDDLALVKYRETVDKTSPQIILLSPAGSALPNGAYYAEFGWLGSDVDVPNADTLWQSDKQILTPTQPARLTWDNGKGLLFERIVAIDDKFMFTITDRVKNSSTGSVTLYPFGLIARHGKPHTNDFYVLHEGPIGVMGGTLQDPTYADVIKQGKIAASSNGGWLGITDKYWLTALAPIAGEDVTAAFTYAAEVDAAKEQGTFQSDFRGTPVTLAAGADAEHVQHFFAGAKELRTLDDYASRYKIPRFYDAIDFGWYWFFTKPFLYLLDFLGHLFGSFGLAILAFTVILKIVTLPLSMKSYRSMAHMKEIQPKLKELQDKYQDDKQKLGLEMMALYKREKINPMSGCWPNLMQIPIFFALYKVLYVGIEMRHAPFYGWIHDLSAPDPTSVLTLFGTLDWAFIPHLGVWPILMGLSMFAQQKMSPAPPDKTQARMFMFMPLIFTFMMGQVAAGLIIYWTWSNIIGIGQQWFIMHKIGGHKK